MSGKSAKKIKLRLGLRAKSLLLEEYPLAAKDITRKGAYWILETGVYDYAGVCRFYCGLADDIEILGSYEAMQFFPGTEFLHPIPNSVLHSVHKILRY